MLLFLSTKYCLPTLLAQVCSIVQVFYPFIHSNRILNLVVPCFSRAVAVDTIPIQLQSFLPDHYFVEQMQQTKNNLHEQIDSNVLKFREENL